MKRSRIAATMLAVALLAAVFPVTHAPAAPNGRIVCIDPGHGGPYSNANRNGLAEKSVNLSIALSLKAQLEARGYTVVITRTRDTAVQLADIPTWNYSESADYWYWKKDGKRGNVPIPKDDLQARTDLSNARAADIFVCIHNNGSTNTRVRGLETYYSPRDAEGRRLANAVHSGILGQTKQTNRGVRSMDFYVLRWSNAPGVLVEGAYISNAADAWLLKQSWFRGSMARGIANGIDRYFAEDTASRLYPRVSGTDAVSLAAASSRALDTTGAPAVLLASADVPAPAMAAPALAARLDAPLLFAAAGTLPTDTASEIARLHPERIVVIGDETVVSSTTAAAAAALSPSATVERISATDAQSASLLMAPYFAGARGVALASGITTANALTAAAWAARYDGPVLLGSGSSAGIASATAPLAASAYALLTVSQPKPVALNPRVHLALTTTHTEWVNRTVMDKFAGRHRPVVATSRSDAAALVSATHAARTKAVLLFSERGQLPTVERLWITNQRPRIDGYTISDAANTSVLLDRELRKSSWY